MTPEVGLGEDEMRSHVPLAALAGGTSFESRANSRRPGPPRCRPAKVILDRASAMPAHQDGKQTPLARLPEHQASPAPRRRIQRAADQGNVTPRIRNWP